MAQEPIELITGPFEVYIAPVSEAFPAIDTEPPGGNWVLIGQNGSTDYGEEGVTVQHPEAITDFRTLGSTGIVKSSRTEEGLIIQFMLHDLSLAHYQYALNLNTVTNNTGASPPNKEIELYRGREVAERALLIRGLGISPEYNGGNVQYEVPRVRPGGQPEPVFTKGVPAGLALEFHALIDLNASTTANRFGTLRAQSGA